MKTATCGCAEGRIGLALGLVLFVSVVVFNPRLIQVMGWRAALVGVGVAFGGALAGKIIGQLRARKGGVQ